MIQRLLRIRSTAVSNIAKALRTTSDTMQDNQACRACAAVRSDVSLLIRRGDDETGCCACGSVSGTVGRVFCCLAEIFRCEMSGTMSCIVVAVVVDVAVDTFAVEER